MSGAGGPRAGDAVLRPYQAESVAAIAAGLGEGGRGQVRMACGTGKTLVAARAAAQLAGRGGVIVVLVPSIALAAQTIAAWPAGCPVEKALAVCSDTTISRSSRAGGLAVPVSTDPELIAKWLADASGRVLIAATYDSALRVAQALRRAGRAADLTVCDEAHRLAGPAGKATAAILAPDVMPERRRLYMTATPRVGAGVAAGGEVLVASMDDEAAFGPVLHSYPFRAAIRDGWLKDYRIVIAALADRQVRDLIAGNPGLVGDRGVPVRMAAAQAALAMTAARFGLRRTLAFLPRVDQARQFAGTLAATAALLPAAQRPAGELTARHVHGRMSTAQREMILDQLRRPPGGGWSVIANARCLGEGVDVPATDSVLFAAPKTSVIDIVQAVGRALRRHGDAATATIIVPALLPDPGQDGSVQDDGEHAASGYESVLRVVRAMCAHDEDLAAGLGAARAARAARAAPAGPAADGLPGQIMVQAPPGTTAQALDALRIRIIDGATTAWDEGYGHARACREAHGHLAVPGSYQSPGGFRLGAWLLSQRILRNSGHLAADRIAALDELGMTWDVLEEAWLRAWQAARDFHAAHGHLEVPATAKTPDGASLATWLTNQRKALREDTAGPGRAALLTQIGLGLSAAEERWMRRYHALTQALAAHGGQRGLPPGSPEATWLANQRVTHAAGRLPPARAALLESAGLVLSRADLWQAHYQELAAFRAASGHTRVPRGTLTASGTDLGSWVTTQRQRKDRLTPGQTALLEEIGFSWDSRQDAWHARYAEAAAFREQHGHLRAAFHTPLGAWIYQQRKKHADGRLTTGQECLLRDLGILPAPQPGTGQEGEPPMAAMPAAPAAQSPA